VIGVPSTGLSWRPWPAGGSIRSLIPASTADGWIGAALVTLPVFLQAPWARLAPWSATLFTAVLVGIGVLLERRIDQRLRLAGIILVGFAGSWLGGSLFWGWCRLHPVWHLPIEGFALPLALAGLSGRWRLGCALYLGSLAGTAATDGVIALTGLMPLWPQILVADPGAAALLLQQAAQQLLQPSALCVLAGAAGLLLRVSQWIWPLGQVGRVAAAALATTLAIDALFLGAALLAPSWSGLI
jgi:hypothetical protein